MTVGPSPANTVHLLPAATRYSAAAGPAFGSLGGLVTAGRTDTPNVILLGTSAVWSHCVTAIHLSFCETSAFSFGKPGHLQLGEEMPYVPWGLHRVWKPSLLA